LFCRGYENAYEEGKRIGIDVFFGWEYTFRGTDLLTYGLDKDWLLQNPGLLDLHINQYCDLVHRDGGFIVHAHPFREADYIDLIRLLPRKIDAVEVMNACRTDFENDCADKYADMYGLLKFAGTDNHRGFLDRLSGIQLKRSLEDIGDMIEAVKNKEAEIFVDIMTE
jgi:predicted metal-dependent phosphoesterase TrpH